MLVLPFNIGRNPESRQGFFVDASDMPNCRDVADALYGSYRSDFDGASLLVVRRCSHREIDVANLTKEVARPLLERLPHVAIHFATSWRFQNKVTGNLNDRVNDLGLLGKDALLDLVRIAELRHYARDAVLRVDHPRIFRAPSGKYCPLFIRVGNVQISRMALNAFFYWLLPSLKNVTAIVTDTWSISSVALNAARLLATYCTGTPQACDVDMLPRYHDGSEGTVSDVKTVMTRAFGNGRGKVLVLISASMSGNLVIKLRNTIQALGLPESVFRFQLLYGLQKESSIPPLCDISEGFRENEYFSYSDEHGDDAQVIEIDGRSYFPLRVSENAHDIKKNTTKKAKEIFERYKNRNVFSVHRDSHLAPREFHRHHGIYVDVGRAMHAFAFRRRFVNVLAGITCPTAIITPPHDAGCCLADFAKRYLERKHNCMVGVHAHVDLDFSNGVKNEALQGMLARMSWGESILIVDDVAITGSRLAGYQKQLRELRFKGRIHYIIGVARPDRKKHWKDQQTRLRYRDNSPKDQHHTADCVEFVLLPNLDAESCPWCNELAVYRQISQSRIELKEEIIRRCRELQIGKSTFQSEKENVFFTLVAHTKLNFTPNSIFMSAPATEGDVFAAVASALQSMRDEEILMPSFPDITVLNWENYLGGHFTDSLLRAAILRAATVAELRYATAAKEAERVKAVSEVLKSNDSGTFNLTAELAVAALLGKVPRKAFVETDRRDDGWDGYSELMEVLHFVSKSHI